MDFSEPAFDATEFVLIGLIQIGAVYVLLRPLEAWFPAEPWADRKAVRVDVLYTFLHRIGLVPIAVYALLRPLVDGTDEMLRALGYIPPGVEDAIPALHDSPFLTFVVYLLVLDFADYWRHRLQHRWGLWWALHSLHHSQRQLSFWADDRNHLLDDVIEGLWFSAIAFMIGVGPEQFVAAVMLIRFVESLSHGNVRFGFGRWGERLLVSPRFHRTHHAIGVGHEGRRYGCNFATLLPLWDIVFGSANFSYRGMATGITDQLGGRDYGESFLAQQWLGLKRLAGRA
ncbi:MAG: sterol desaturase family protein [Burkholderiales bacterium]|nr:sterol desaturase family protein [Burkholderiales bacterium]